ncbi:peptide/nickel transport system substrate-binding protein [Streptosporangium album]|uniref:Peptide/nickel transport system substrate-binding protein n=1 Tax=Streptosporangium album TaxID=47479 RepID=A0A7W7WCM5_9ACTN|nr:ABC transporter substrate-binding protein [Streptosporangium album]MBB4941414.1 peptide/nickel transport system substrate-binding protein [Streptosporangium album]
MTVRKRSAVAVLAIGVLALTGACAKGNQGAPAVSSGGPGAQAGAEPYKPPTITVGTADDSKGPAIEPEGVVRGGAVTMIDRDDFSHLDPAQVYSNTEANFGLLIARTLTGYKRVAKGDYKLVGDLATDAGTPSDGGRTWTFTLKDGVKWQDGTPITSQDVKWTIERTFAPFITQGPTYVQQWLTEVDHKKAYQGPYDGKHLENVETPDDKTVVFRFKAPHADANYALAMGGYGIVSKAGDTKQKYDQEPVSSGPYVIKAHAVDKSMDLERNPSWDPATDPIRGGYPDTWHLEFGQEALQVTDRLMADAGPDKTAFTFYSPTPPERLQQVLGDPALTPRLMRSPSPYGNYYYFNLDRMKDVKIRQAVNYAWPSKQIQQIYGGPAAVALPTTILNENSTLGYTSYDLFGRQANPGGDIAKAKELLAQSSNPAPTIVYAYNQTPLQERITVAIKNALEKAGIKVVAKPLDRKTYYDSIGLVKNEFDMYWGGWGADWPSGSTVLPVIFGPVADGASNYSHLNDPALKKEMAKITAMTDLDEANAAWMALDKKVQETITPLVVAENRIANMLHGSKVGGAEIDPQQWIVSPNTIFVKP